MAPTAGNTGGGGDDPAPGSGFVTSVVSDPIGDTFHDTGGKQRDLTTFTVSRDTAGVTAKLDFTTDVVSPTSGDTTAIIGFVEFDLDQDVATGSESVVDHFRPDAGSATLGVDARVDKSVARRSPYRPPPTAPRLQSSSRMRRANAPSPVPARAPQRARLTPVPS